MDKIRLIDATALSAAISAAQHSLVSSDDEQWSCDKKYYKGLAWSQRLVREAPTIAKLTPAELAGLRAMIYRHQIPSADAAPVRRGKWIELSRSSRCSECGFETGRYEPPRRYCPECGAKMDWKEDGHEAG